MAVRRQGSLRRAIGHHQHLPWRFAGRALVSGIISSLIGGGLLTYYTFFNIETPKTISLAVWKIVCILTIVGIISIILTWSIFRRRIRCSLALKWHLHEITHYLRDKVNASEKNRMVRSRTQLNKSVLSANLREIYNSTCDYIRDYFRRLISDQTVECCIRLVDKDTEDPSDSSVLFCTSGRSNGLSAGRDKNTEHISARKGIPRFFHEEKDCQGVFIIHDLKRANQVGLFQMTKNEEIFPKDIKTLMVAPINGWTGKKTRMIGLFYVTSKKDPFTVKHVDLVKMFADMLGVSIARIVNTTFDKRSHKFTEKKGVE